MRISIIIGLVALIVAVVSFILAFIFFERRKQDEKVQEFFLWIFLIGGSVFSICFIINIPYFWSLFKEFLAHIFH